MKYIWAVKKIQSYQRVYIAKERVRKIRDPYGDLNFNQMEELLLQKQDELHRCIERKQFLQAADLEKEIDIIQIEKEGKRPLTRSFLELKISDAQDSN